MPQIGDKCWIWSDARRSYGKDRRLILRESYREAALLGETRSSWLAGSPGLPLDAATKFDKKTLRERTNVGAPARLFLTEQAVEDEIFVETHRWKIAESVRCLNAPVLREVARIIGYDYNAPVAS